mmetsp:Transcript_8616/g.14588  ORF Transcript_8616/g.14588 Transcript_8616/m.14588 type:complete len:312 (-) Transcript_8616:56-991(-)
MGCPAVHAMGFKSGGLRRLLILRAHAHDKSTQQHRHHHDPARTVLLSPAPPPPPPASTAATLASTEQIRNSTAVSNSGSGSAKEVATTPSAAASVAAATLPTAATATAMNPNSTSFRMQQCRRLSDWSLAAKQLDRLAKEQAREEEAENSRKQTALDRNVVDVEEEKRQAASVGGGGEDTAVKGCWGLGGHDSGNDSGAALVAPFFPSAASSAPTASELPFLLPDTATTSSYDSSGRWAGSKRPGGGRSGRSSGRRSAALTTGGGNDNDADDDDDDDAEKEDDDDAEEEDEEEDCGEKAPSTTIISGSSWD